MKITVETNVNASIASVWHAYTTPDDIIKWNAASDDWHTTKASVDLREGGEFSSRMEAKDGSFGFDFAGTYTKIVPNKLIEYAFGDRGATVEFLPSGDTVNVRVRFDAEAENPADMQRDGWQAILNNFKKHVEGAKIPTESTNQTLEIITTREFNATPETLFAAFSNPESLAQWWGPDGFTNEFHIFDFREGGEWDFTMRTDGAPEFHNQSRFLKIHEPRHISFLHLGPIHVFTMLMDYEPMQHGTRLTWVMQMEDTPQAHEMKHFIEAANEQNFDRLAQFIAS